MADTLHHLIHDGQPAHDSHYVTPEMWAEVGIEPAPAHQDNLTPEEWDEVFGHTQPTDEDYEMWFQMMNDESQSESFDPAM